ncbi:MAG: adenosylcobinamide amidohydrolase [Deltaproteobacteria bacterium]|nr:adenosylcobinamide amidohydrolase [Deltaproteobacteria bacterium]
MQGNELAALYRRGDDFVVHRLGRFLIAELLIPHLALSTCPVNGGQSERVRFVVNHQSCEGTDHVERYNMLSAAGPDKYHRQVCNELGLAPEEVILMGTAANMNYAAHQRASFEELTVEAIVTAGVQGNAARAADPAGWAETAEGWKKMEDFTGTINTMLFVNHPLTPAALARAVVTMTEGKSAALQELAVPSKYSPHLATGTGTDQYCIAAPRSADRVTLTSTSPHVKLGEMIGRVVLDATKEALRWQNGLETSLTRSITHALGRFGLTEPRLMREVGARLSEQDRMLFERNRNALLFEPALASHAYAYAAVLDRIQYGTVPKSLASDVLREQAAGMASALAAKPHLWLEFFQQIEVNGEQPLDAVVVALALGWAKKWI